MRGRAVHPSTTGPVLSALVGDLDRFEAHHWGVRPLHRSTACRFADLLDLDDVDRLLASGLRRPAFRLVRDGGPLAPDAGTRTVRLGGRVLDDVADPGRVAEELAAGATLVLQALQRTWPPVERWCRELEAEVGHTVQANAYLTPAGAKGLAEHSDDHAVLVLGVHGTKHWTVDGIGPLSLAPGDVLYLPAGVRHAASAQDDTTLHLTVGLLCTTLGDAVRRALDGAGLARPLPLGFDRPERRGHLAAALEGALAAAAGHLAAADPGRAADREVARRAARRRRDPRGRVRSVALLADLDDAAVVAARPDAAALGAVPSDRGDDRVSIELADRRVHLPAAMAPALRVLLAGGPVRVGDLPGLDAGDRLVLVRRLVREGVLDVARPGQKPGSPGE